MGTAVLNRAHFNTQPGSPSAVGHGDELTVAMTGPWALQGVSRGVETLVELDPDGERISTFPGWGRPSWIPGTDYVYNNDPGNLGGVVPAGGLTIDGYDVPEGTWVVQFRDFTAGVTVEGDAAGAGAPWPGVLFRGCRMRGNWSSPGFVNYNAIANNGETWFMFCDAGGLDVAPPNICESIIESQGNGPNDRQYLIRCYLSIGTTLSFGRNHGDAWIECYGEIVPVYYGDDTYHLNGLANAGGQTATLWLRNHLSFSPQDDALSLNPFYKSQNDVIQMAAEGAYPGTGTNLDGSVGYQMRDNYLGGAEHVFQLGVDKANGPEDVSNVVITGNKLTTYWFNNGGQTAVSYKNPTWDTQGNLWSGNTWADDYGTGAWSYTTANASRQYPDGTGPRAGAAITAPI